MKNAPIRNREDRGEPCLGSLTSPSKQKSAPFTIGLTSCQEYMNGANRRAALDIVSNRLYQNAVFLFSFFFLFLPFLFQMFLSHHKTPATVPRFTENAPECRVLPECVRREEDLAPSFVASQSQPDAKNREIFTPECLALNVSQASRSRSISG